jgi:hypothetical protein
LPKPTIPSCFSKPDCQRDITSTAPTSRLIILSPATPSQSAPIRGSHRGTGPRESATRYIRTSPGPTSTR